MAGKTWRRRLGLPAPTDPLMRGIQPYLVPPNYPDTLSTPDQQQRTIGHGLSVALVAPSAADGSGSEVLAAVTADQLAAAGIELDAAYARAEQNLTSALSTGRIEMTMLELGPAAVPAVVFGGSWLAATALLVPGLHAKMTRVLGDDVVAAVPHRDLMFVFAAAGIAGMAEIVSVEYGAAAKPFTTGLFAITADGPQPAGQPTAT